MQGCSCTAKILIWKQFTREQFEEMKKGSETLPFYLQARVCILRIFPPSACKDTIKAPLLSSLCMLNIVNLHLSLWHSPRKNCGNYFPFSSFPPSSMGISKASHRALSVLTLIPFLPFSHCNMQLYPTPILSPTCFCESFSSWRRANSRSPIAK